MIRTVILASLAAALLAFAGGLAFADGECSKAKGDATTKIEAPKPLTASTN